MKMSSAAGDAAADRAARLRALDPRASFIVQAPAGSGKTELLVQRYLRLLATVEHPEQVLAITFTRKAAAEMRNRIVGAVERAAGPAPKNDHERLTWDLAKAVRARDLQLEWQLAQHPARLRIQTIDALNALLARRLPILSGTGAALEPTDDPQPLYEAACERLIERLGEGSRESASLEVLVEHLGNRVDRLVGLLIALLKKRDQWLHPIVHARAADDLRRTLERTLLAVVEHHLIQLCELLSDERRATMWEMTLHAAEHLSNSPTLAAPRRALFEACSRHARAPRAEGRSLKAWQAIASVLFKQDGTLYLKVNALQGFPSSNTEVRERMHRLLRELAEDRQLCEQLVGLRTLPSTEYSDEQWHVLEALLEVLPSAVAELQLVFQAHGKADYVEGALRALRALGGAVDPTDLALAFDHRLRHILIDEFQDTSFSQLDLLERLTAGFTPGDGRTLFCVGDPMQSIYRFRQAEVGLFLELQQRGLPNVQLQPLTLSANFRSTPTVIDWINRVFPAVLAQADDPEQGAVRYSPSVPVGSDQSGGVHVHALIDGSPVAEARRVVTLVKSALKRDRHGKVAVLVTARTHVGSIANELAKARIDFQAVEIELLRDRPVVQDLIALTRALIHAADRTAWLAVLRAPWCGLALRDLHALAGAEGEETIGELLAAKQSGGFADLSADGRARVTRAYTILVEALAERGRHSLRDWVERTWNALRGPATLSREQDMADAEAYLRRLDAIDTAGDLADVARLEEQLEHLCARPRSASSARVEIMTIHKAKGLEFDTVILPSMHRRLRGEERELLRWSRIAGAQGGLVFAPVKAEGADADPIYRWMELLEVQRAARERGRLLYVAATRAKRDLHLLGSAQIKMTHGARSLREPHGGSMLGMLWHELRPPFEAAAAQAQISEQLTLPLPASVLLKRLPLNWQPPEADAPVQSERGAAIEISRDRPEFDWVTHTSRHIGTLVHRELDRMTHRMAEQREAPSASQLESARRRLMAELAELGVPPDRCERAAQRVIAAIWQTLADARGRWLLGLDGSVRDSESELALSAAVEGDVVEGVIDRTFVDEAGTRWIVDFKTSTHEGGGLEDFLAAEAERYRGQLTRYARLMQMFKPDQPVRAALYFPLLSQWREVSVA
jgi:ATP-dependent helicase/nuclease subunit A